MIGEEKEVSIIKDIYDLLYVPDKPLKLNY